MINDEVIKEMMNLIMAVCSVVIGVVVGILVYKIVQGKKEDSAVSKAEKLLQEAANKAEQSRKDLMAETRDEIHRLRQEVDRERQRNGVTNSSALSASWSRRKRTSTENWSAQMSREDAKQLLLGEVESEADMVSL